MFGSRKRYKLKKCAGTTWAIFLDRRRKNLFTLSHGWHVAAATPWRASGPGRDFATFGMHDSIAASNTKNNNSNINNSFGLFFPAQLDWFFFALAARKSHDFFFLPGTSLVQVPCTEPSIQHTWWYLLPFNTWYCSTIIAASFHVKWLRWVRSHLVEGEQASQPAPYSHRCKQCTDMAGWIATARAGKGRLGGREPLGGKSKKETRSNMCVAASSSSSSSSKSE